MLLNEADKAMYHAKSHGRGRVEVFDAALGRQVQLRSTAQKMLQAALDDHRVIVYYQPVIDLGTGRIVAVRGPRPHRRERRLDPSTR